MLLACSAPAEGTSPTTAPAQTTLLAFATAVDPGFPGDPARLADAVQQGFERWQIEGTGLRVHNQGTSDVATLGDDGLQVVWLWWQSEPWPADASAWLVSQRYERDGLSGFDLLVQGPVCPGEAEEAGRYTAISNAVALGVGLSLGLIPDADPQSALAQQRCETTQALLPSQAEAAALAALINAP